MIYYNLKYCIKVRKHEHIYERISGSISVCQSENLLRRNEQKIYDINRLSHILYTIILYRNHRFWQVYQLKKLRLKGNTIARVATIKRKQTDTKDYFFRFFRIFLFLFFFFFLNHKFFFLYSLTTIERFER